MWFYKESFRLFSILIFTLIGINIVESLKAKFVSSNEIKNIENIETSGGKNINHNLSKIIIFIHRNEKNSYGLSDLLIKVYNMKVIKDLKIHNILRETYEDACIKVAIRKCYKAMLGVKNKLCKLNYRCKSDFQDDFKEISKSACIEEFDYSEIILKKSKTVKFRGAAEFVDATRQRYIDMCIPYMAQQLKLKRDNKESNFKKTFVPHIFRNADTASERECQQISQDKCIFACRLVRKRLCFVPECGRRKRKYFKKACKEVCKREYRVKKYSSESDYDR